jgi:hypothetical protein
MNEQVNNKPEEETKSSEVSTMNADESTNVQGEEKLNDTFESKGRNSKPGIPISMSFSTDRNKLALFQKLSALQKDLEQMSPEVIHSLYEEVLGQLFHIMNHDKPPPVICRLIAGCFVALHKPKNSFEEDTLFLYPSRQFLIRANTKSVSDLEKESMVSSDSEKTSSLSIPDYLAIAVSKCYDIIRDKHVDEWGKLAAYWCICWVSATFCHDSHIGLIKRLVDIFRDSMEWLLYYLNKIVRHDVARAEAFYGLIYFIEAHGKLFDLSQVKILMTIFKKQLSIKRISIRVMVAKCVLSLLYSNISSRTLNHELQSLLNVSIRYMDISEEIGESVIEMMSHLLFYINSKSHHKDFDVMMEWLQTHLWKWLGTNDEHLNVARLRSMEFYTYYFRQLGLEWMEIRFSSILLHLDHFLHYTRVTSLIDLLPSIQSSCDIVFQTLILINSIHIKRSCLCIIFNELYKRCEDIKDQEMDVYQSGFILFLLMCLRKILSHQDGILIIHQVRPFFDSFRLFFFSNIFITMVV